MKTLKIDGIEKEFFITPGSLYSIKIESNKQFMNVVNSLLYFDEEKVIYSENYTMKPLSKYSLLITNVFDISLNDKKRLQTLYKKICSDYKLKFEDELHLINQRIINMLKDLRIELNSNIVFNVDLDLCKLLEVYKVSYEETSDMSFLEKLVLFVKSYLDIQDIKILFLIDSIKYLSNDEVHIFLKEMGYLGITVFDIFYERPTFDIGNLSVIDEDFCEL